MRTGVLFMIGLVIGAAGVVAFTDIGPVQVNATLQSDSPTDSPTPGNDQETLAGGESGGDQATNTKDSTDTQTEADGPLNPVVESEIFGELQTTRKRERSGGLTRSDRLDRLAAVHTSDMVQYDFFANQSPWGDTLSDRMVQEDVSCSQVFDNSAGEYVDPQQIIYRYQGSSYPSAAQLSEDAIATWLKTQPDRRWVLLEEWTEVGISAEVLRESGEETVYVTVVFC